MNKSNKKFIPYVRPEDNYPQITFKAVIAVAIIILYKVLEAKEFDFRAPVLAVAVGIYLPLELPHPFLSAG